LLLLLLLLLLFFLEYVALLPEFLEETCCLANEQEFVATQQAKQVAYPPKVTLPHREVTQEAARAAAAAQAQKPAQTAVPAQKTQAQLTGHRAALAALAAAAAALLEVDYPL
jgi:septal ring-binding cell division protein DamX